MTRWRDASSRSRPFSVTPSLIATRVPASDARGLRQRTGHTGGPVEYAEAADRDVHETGCRADSDEQVRREEVVDGFLGLERVHAAEDPLGAVGEPNLRSESGDRGEGRSELVARVRELLLGESVKVEVHDQDLHSDLLGRAGGPQDDDDVPPSRADEDLMRIGLPWSGLVVVDSSNGQLSVQRRTSCS